MKIKAFTLVELMVVMAIIAFLSVGAYGGLTYALRQGRDTQRIRIADQIQTAVIAYYADHGYYPGCQEGNAENDSAWGACIFSLAAGAASTVGNDELFFYSDDILKPYFESEFKYGPIARTAPAIGKDLVYYYKRNVANNHTAGGAEYTVCVQLENKKGASVISQTNGNPDKGCYCNGAGATHLACTGMD